MSFRKARADGRELKGLGSQSGARGKQPPTMRPCAVLLVFAVPSAAVCSLRANTRSDCDMYSTTSCAVYFCPTCYSYHPRQCDTMCGFYSDDYGNYDECAPTQSPTTPGPTITPVPTPSPTACSLRPDQRDYYCEYPSSYLSCYDSNPCETCFCPTCTYAGYCDTMCGFYSVDSDDSNNDYYTHQNSNYDYDACAPTLAPTTSVAPTMSPVPTPAPTACILKPDQYDSYYCQNPSYNFNNCYGSPDPCETCLCSTCTYAGYCDATCGIYSMSENGYDYDYDACAPSQAPTTSVAPSLSVSPTPAPTMCMLIPDIRSTCYTSYCTSYYCPTCTYNYPGQCDTTCGFYSLGGNYDACAPSQAPTNACSLREDHTEWDGTSYCETNPSYIGCYDSNPCENCFCPTCTHAGYCDTTCGFYSDSTEDFDTYYSRGNVAYDVCAPSPLPTTTSPTPVPIPRPTSVPTSVPTPSQIIITSPNASTSWALGATKVIRWTSSGRVDRFDEVSVHLYANGMSQSMIAGSIINDGSLIWSIASTLLPGDNLKIRVFSLSDSVAAYSEPFTLVAVPMLEPTRAPPTCAPAERAALRARGVRFDEGAVGDDALGATTDGATTDADDRRGGGGGGGFTEK